VTPGGQVVSENSFAGAQVVADQIAVIPVGIEKEAKAVNYDLDEGIEKNLDAALIQNKLHYGVKQVVDDLHAKKPESQLFAIGPARLILYEGGRAVVFRIALPQTTKVNSQTQRQLPT
jgi:hypothetical protein